MNPSEAPEVQLQTGYFFSPGFYVNYWQNTILTNFSPSEVVSDNRLKEHREMWIGAQLAALKTKLSGKNHFVGLPPSDPPDVLIGCFEEHRVPSGRIGHNLNWYPVENTRCDMSAGEDVLTQIDRKNTQAYTNTVLLVYLQGVEVVPDMKAIYESITSKDVVHLHEIIVMVQLQSEPNGLPAESFGFVQVYPKYDSAVISRNDTDAYFLEPNIMTATGRGIQSSVVSLGQIRLMPPV